MNKKGQIGDFMTGFVSTIIIIAIIILYILISPFITNNTEIKEVDSYSMSSYSAFLKMYKNNNVPDKIGLPEITMAILCSNRENCNPIYIDYSSDNIKFSNDALNWYSLNEDALDNFQINQNKDDKIYRIEGDEGYVYFKCDYVSYDSYCADAGDLLNYLIESITSGNKFQEAKVKIESNEGDVLTFVW